MSPEKENSLLFTEIFNRLDDAVLVTTADLKLFFFNKKAGYLFNPDYEKGLEQFTFFQKELQVALKSLQTDHEKVAELSYRISPEQTLFFEVKLKHLDINNKIYISMIFSDITRIKNLEKQILHSQRMESIGFLAGGIVHEINNLFTPILMSIKYIRRNLKDETSRKMLETMKSSVERGTQLIKQVLIFSRAEEEDFDFINFSEIVKEIKIIVTQAFPKNIKTDFEIQSDLWEVKGNFTQLYQVILNLCLNASDAMPHGGKLKLIIKNLEADKRFGEMAGLNPGRYLQIIISDTGVGIPEHIIPKIFDPFYTSKEVGKGTGLGLPTSLTIIRKHGGIIKVYSIYGKGTTFKIYLPVQIQELRKNVKYQEFKDIPKGNGETVLVVDDEIKILTTIEEILRSNGYKVIKAENGQEALKIFRKNSGNINLVLTDVQMPHGDGYHVLEEVSCISDIPVILSSGLISAGEVEAEDLNPLFLFKPYTEEKLLNTIAAALGKVV